MTPFQPPPRPGPTQNHSRISIGVLIVACLSGGPFVGLSRWVAEDPLSFDNWPFVYTVWAAAVLGAGMFVLDVVAPIAARGVKQSEMLLVAIATPLALALWTLGSAVWTKSPGLTPSQALLMALVVLTAIWFGDALTFRQQVMSLFIGLHAMTVLSLVISVALESARLGENDEWTGIFASPDLLSPVAGLGLVAAIGAALLTTEMWQRVGIAALVVVDLVVAVMSGSSTGWLSIGAAMLAFALVLVVRGTTARGGGGASNGARVAYITAVTGALLALPIGIMAFGDSLSDDSPLAARSRIWDAVFDAVEDRWIVGFGFQSVGDISADVGFSPSIGGAHSTFVETLLSLGAIGLILLLAVVVFNVGRVWWQALGGQSWAMGWWAAVATFALVENVTESMLNYHSIFWVLLVSPGFAAIRYAVSMANTTGRITGAYPVQYSSYTYQ
jgi:exopolysaccharide production protein ExoQ